MERDKPIFEDELDLSASLGQKSEGGLGWETESTLHLNLESLKHKVEEMGEAVRLVLNARGKEWTGEEREAPLNRLFTVNTKAYSPALFTIRLRFVTRPPGRRAFQASRPSCRSASPVRATTLLALFGTPCSEQLPSDSSTKAALISQGRETAQRPLRWCARPTT